MRFTMQGIFQPAVVVGTFVFAISCNGDVVDRNQKGVMELACYGEHDNGNMIMSHLSLRNKNKNGSYTEYKHNGSLARQEIVSSLDRNLSEKRGIGIDETASWSKISKVTPKVYKLGGGGDRLDRVTLTYETGWGGQDSTAKLSCQQESLKAVVEREEKLFAERIRKFDEKRRGAKGVENAEI